MRSITGLKYVLVTLFIIICTFCCKKEYSYEGGQVITAAHGSLQDSLGNCRNIAIKGSYVKDTSLTNVNTVTVIADITQIGQYVIGTDTINGYWFRDTGFVTSTGLQNFVLKGYGMPQAAEPDYFTVYFDHSSCNFMIPLALSNYTFDAPAGTCPAIHVHGSYKTAIALNSADTVNVPVNVITPGTYSVQTSIANGMIYSAKGVFANAGSTMLTLTGSGAPTTAGSTTVPITMDNRNCSFLVEVSNRVVDTSQFWTFTAEGITYKGYVDSIYLNISNLPNNLSDTIYSLDFFGIFPDSLALTNSLIFQFDLGRINHNVTTGIYHPAPVADFKDYYGDIYYFNSITGISYNTSTSLPTFAIKLDTYDLSTRLMHCTFSGPVLNASGQTINITNGEVKAYLAH